MDDHSHQSSIHHNLNTQDFFDVDETLAKQTKENFHLKEMFSQFMISQERNRERFRSSYGEGFKNIETIII